MQKTIWTMLVIASLSLLTVGCDNELDVAADWKEVAIVYGALNPNQTKNYVRIQKAFLDEKQGAFSFVNNQDSLYFDTLIVTITEQIKRSGDRDFSNTQSFNLVKVNGNDIGIPKDTGIFYSDENVLYELDAEIKPSMALTDYKYVLTVLNPRTGYVCIGETVSVGQAEVYSPINETGGTIYITASEGHFVIVKFQEGKFARAYRVDMDIRLEEYKLDNPSEVVTKTIKWPLVSLGNTKGLSGFKSAEYQISSSGFFSALSQNLEVDPTLGRRLVNFDFTFYGISDDFNTFLNVSEPSIGIVQKKPEFTNIENGLGIFASRNIRQYKDRNFNSIVVTALRQSELTKDLGF
jgi:hypothetical protein